MATVPLGRYLWERIHQVGINQIFGVPGDFNLTLLDHIYDVEGLEWVGNTNELNSAYAADGYARVRNGAGCTVTTHGVGELSALNGVAGAMTEQVKVIHVVGQTSRVMQEKHMMIHHSIGNNPDHQIFNNASRNFRVAAAEIQTEVGAGEEIDRTLRECFVQSKPVYIFVPIDLVDKPIPAEPLKTPLNLEPDFDAKAVEEAAKATLEALYTAKNPSIFVDCLVERHNAVAEIKQVVDKLQLPIYTSNMGKGIIDEDHPNYVGLYNGIPSGAGVQAAAEACDFTLVIGSLPADTNSGGFTRVIPANKSVNIDPDQVVVKGEKTYTIAPIKKVLAKLAELIESDRIPKVAVPKLPERPVEDDADSKLITQSWIWHRIASFLQANDVIFGETGTAAFGLPDATFPAGTQWITQTYYGSIGYATPAAFGTDVGLADLAKTTSHPRGRTVLVTGDGSLMLTVQEVGNMIKQNAAPIIFIINNAGYTIERVIHGAKQSYNDIVPFNYSFMLQFFNMPADQAKECFHRAENKAELEEILKLDRVVKPKNVQIVEVMMDMMDVPWRLSTGVAMRGPEAVKEMKEAGFKVRELNNPAANGFWN
ncbi:pyruvate decarboxylase [Acrodontium crateriforme]|uniref:Pyruvate decarboxylase n=1 Tax=Acrodontium crateriforme TaxID=150365 RepID=A0AAQ3R4V0_9PEZI|nr:pyruvate decarboxylase [Acrodontium crateriforme]